ncbi:rod shape-determining protein RodA [Breznakiella homolactica]|uniref:Peptidoglycan glycosyltransferase RodA n=1 Tax=Breznakiella homolactica TaxID=2798577 RepID=A0A7T7XKR2_9SPIR|nr:rod shape-determining protein RodA [Breznakiella homolactica]QQO08161.1 rod shape-determining protein RodA [Breznakiella homolactica]
MRLRNFLEIDFSLFFSAVILTVFGILFIYSSGITSTGVLVSTEYIRQIIWAVSGVIIALVIVMLDYRRIYDLSIYIYLGILALLLYTVFFGRLVNGARAWIGIGVFGIQPSEFAKIATILLLARYLDVSRHNQNEFKRFFVSCMIVFIPMGIILLQPDFGTSLVFIPILLVMTFIAGIALRYIIFLIACIFVTSILLVLPLWQSYILQGTIPSLMILTNIRFIVIVTVAFTVIGLIALYGFMRFKKRYFYWIVYGASIVVLSLGASFMAGKVLKDYQIMRLIVFLNPNVDPRGSGWNIIQSITAIGSGGLLGKGYLQGTQSHYRFLPQQSTDFIFSIFSEEWGFIGGLLVFSLFLLMLLRLVKIMRSTSDPFGSYIVAGFAAMVSFHFLINVGMAMGIMPITGIPLLFMSYGGSSLTSAMIGIGLSLSIYVRRFQH